MSERWLIYGAYGYTGQQLVEEAVRRGHQPTLAGRSAHKLRPLAERYGLPSVAVGLDDPAGLRRAIEGHALVLHAAGPFSQTHAPMLKACLDAPAHYLDITGEISVFEDSFAHDRQAREKNVAILSGVGFDVVPSDCLARYVAEKVTDPTHLELAFSGIGSPSAGTLKSSIEGFARGGFVRREGVLVPWPMGTGVKTVRFLKGERTVMPIPWGDLSTAFHTTGIPNITTYATTRASQARALRLIAPLAQPLVRVDRLRALLMRLAESRARGPTASQQQHGRSHFFAEARNARGERAQAWLETMEGYRLTAIAAVRAVERTLASSLKGALTPSRAFGADFVLELPDTVRRDAPG